MAGDPDGHAGYGHRTECITDGTPTYLLRQAIEQGYEQGYLKTTERDLLTDLLESRHE